MKYTVGTLAYFDSMRGLIPCKVTKITKEFDMSANCKVVKVFAKVTADKYPYHKGEMIESRRFYSIVPRACVYTRNGQFRIRNTYEWTIGE